MSILEETQQLVVDKDIFYSKTKIIPNNYFTATQGTSTTGTGLPAAAKEFVILLLSYELNYQPQKLDYYYRTAKRLQQLFQIPGWQLLLPTTKTFSTKTLRKKIILKANQFKSDIQKGTIQISLTQAASLNKAYKNFLWE